MDFIRAFKFPFRNSPKVISIVLTLTIAFVICVMLMANAVPWESSMEVAGDWTSVEVHNMDFSASAVVGLLGLFALLVVVGGFWMNGYSIAVIREVMHGSDSMPAVDFAQNLRQGAWLFISALAIIALNVILWVAALVAVSITGSLGLPEILTVIVTLSGFVLAVAVAALTGWAYFIGMARYAIERERASLFAIAANIGIARANIGSGLRLALMMLLLSAIYGLVRGAVEGLLGGFAGSDVVVMAAVSVSVYFGFNLFQHFSTQHLIAQYALAAGLGAGKPRDQEKPKVE